VAELERRRGGTRATVYRFVEWLCDHGWLERVYSDDTRHTYVRRQPGHRHQAICTSCGVTIVVDSCAVEELVAPRLAEAWFAVRGHVLEFYGLCRACPEQPGAPMTAGIGSQGVCEAQGRAKGTEPSCRSPVPRDSPVCRGLGTRPPEASS
jgi:hypothetical protein